jgi:hypothetical protein
MIEIEVQWPGKSLGEAQDFARTFGCEAHKTKHRYYYRITADDPIKFYWLGANVNNAALNEVYPSNLSKFIEL